MAIFVRADGEVVQEFNPQVLDQMNIKPEYLQAVKNGMIAANEADGGTASATFRNFPIPTAGKTGTADFSNNQRTVGRAPFATYVSFAPVDKPEIAVVAVVVFKYVTSVQFTVAPIKSVAVSDKINPPPPAALPSATV